jgi:hypothetical protein
MTGTEVETFCEEVNARDRIGATVLFQFVSLAKAMVEQTRPWMLLRCTTWQTAIDLSGIPRFNRFYGDTPIKLVDGANGIQHFRQVPFDRRLEYRNTLGTFVYDEAASHRGARPVSVYRRIVRGADATHTHWVALQEDKCVGESFHALRNSAGSAGCRCRVTGTR